jgi:broad specificity phosphatase PhoE
MSNIQNTSFVAIRHGQSEANLLKLIASSDLLGGKYGLTKIGEQQVHTTSLKLKSLLLDKQVMIHSSPFLRTRQTTDILAKSFPNTTVIVQPALKERYFGVFDGKFDDNYDNVWQADVGVLPEEWQVESCSSVAQRTWNLVQTLAHEYPGMCHLLVAHGDALQILQTQFLNISPQEHRSLPHIDTAGYRILNFLSQ